MNKTGKKRLLQLADFLETLGPERFDLQWWAYNGFSPNKCGTTACAVGWATTIPAFKKAGLKLYRDYDDGLYPIYKTYDSWDAVKVFFKLSMKDAEWLFNSGYYPVEQNNNPKYVAKRIREFVTERELI